MTDANLLLGRLARGAARRASSRSDARRTGARGIGPAAVVEVVNAEMLRALRVVSVERGHDPRDFTLVAFGGAGPLHACELAEELGMRAVLVPAARACSRRSGWPRATSRVTVCLVRAAARRGGQLPEEGEAELRYRGQSFELDRGAPPGLAETFPPEPTRSATATPTRAGR